MLNNVTNFQLPPAFLTEIAELVTPSASGVTYSYDSNSSNPLYNGFIAQSVIIDGRGLKNGDQATISFGGAKFQLVATSNVYRAYVIPAYNPTEFKVVFNDNASAASNCMVRLYNYQMLPCNYLKTGV